MPEVDKDNASQRLDAATATALRSAAAKWPEFVGQRAEALAVEHLAYRKEYAAQLGPIIDAQIKQAIRDVSDYEMKKELIKSINEQMRLGGVAIRFEVKNKAGEILAVQPAYLVIGSSRDGTGRFRLESQAEGEKQSYGLTEESPPVTLMPVPAQHSVQLDGPVSESFAGRVTASRPMQASKLRQ